MSCEKSKKTESVKSDYRNDKSLTSSTGDQFKHFHYVRVLLDVLEKCQTPFNIGLYGKWGVGKSSIVHMLREKIEKEKSDEYKYVEVDAWGLSGESLQQGILEKINSQLGDSAIPQQEIEDELYNIKEIESMNFTKIPKKTISITAVLAIAFGLVTFLYSQNVVESLSIGGIITATVDENVQFRTLLAGLAL